MTLTEFLLARIAEDEVLARSAEEHAQTPWRATYGRQVETARDGYLVTPEDEHSYTTDPPDEVALHIARHDPARVLAEGEAKRRIVEMHAPGQPWCDCGTWDTTIHGDEGYEVCPTLRALVVIYAGHPDCRDEWRP